ncbi:MAG: glycosyltransferase [Nitrosarchaeum sp.]|nr:glycosyltransferase [Nitrosarchaeum sp.]
MGLNIIVGDNDVIELERCLKSVIQGPLFDEIVITVTGKEKKAWSVAEKYTKNIFYFEWIRDFAAARNFCIEQTKSDYIFWMDADDVIKAKDYQRLLQIKNTELHLYDIILIKYAYFHDANDRRVHVLPRERIFRRCSEIRFHKKIHEAIAPGVNFRQKRYDDVFTDHYRTRVGDVNRNLEILKEMYELDPNDDRNAFYYGKDLFDTGHEESIPILERYVRRGFGSVDDQASACFYLAKYYYYSKKDVKTAKDYLILGISVNNQYSELFLLLADIFKSENNIDDAILYTEEALSKSLNANFGQNPDNYTSTPASHLSQMYFTKGDKLTAFKYTLVALETQANDLGLQSDLKVHLTNFKIKVCWLIPQLDLTYPSIRLRRYNIHQKLAELGVESTVVTDYYNRDIESEVEKFDFIIFTQHSEYDYKLMQKLKSKNKKLIFDHCEDIFHCGFEDNCMQLADKIICCSTVLAEHTNQVGYSQTCVFRDAIEDKKVIHDYSNHGKLKAVYMGMGGNAHKAFELKDVIEKAGYELVVISEWDDATKKWSMDNWHNDLNEADVAICPQRVDLQPAKSNVKVTTAMSMGIPVVASPLNAYQEVIDHGVNGYLCHGQDEWYRALMELKDSNHRKMIGERAKATVYNYTIDAITTQYIRMFFEIKYGEIKKNDSKLVSTDVIVLNYNNFDYLKLCIDSIRRNTNSLYRLIIVDAGSNDETWDQLDLLKAVNIFGERGKRFNYSQTANIGMRASFSRLFAILNSDVIVSKNWLENAIEKFDKIPRLAACGVLSNCDKGWLHNFDMKFVSGLELRPGMKIEELTGKIDELDSYMTASNDERRGQFIDREWVAGYATVYAKSAVVEVNVLDPEYVNGCEDLDLCMRLKKYNYKIGQAYDSFVFHFGGVSRGAYELENKQYHTEDAANHARRKKKWEKEKVVIYTGPAFEKWNKTKVESGMGGSETWAAELAKQFSRAGFFTVIYCDFDIENINNIRIEDDGEIYRHYSKIQDDFQYDCIDYLIASRTCDIFDLQNIHAINKYVMIHDIWLSIDSNYDTRQWQVKKYAVLSDWHKQFVMGHHKISEDKIMMTSNGVDQSLYTRLAAENIKKKNKIFYSSSPDRGLLQLLQMFSKIREQVPDLELVVAYGFFNWEAAIKNRGNPEQEVQHLQTIKNLMNQPGVISAGRLSKIELARHQFESKAWIYPTAFWETFCITAVEAGLANCAILSSYLAGLITTVNDAGILLQGENTSDEYQRQFIEIAVRLLTDEAYRRMWAEKANKRMLIYTWEKSFQSWMNEFKPQQAVQQVVQPQQNMTIDTTAIEKSKNETKRKLNLGCGNRKAEGYIGVDIFPGKFVDEIFSIIKIPYKDNTIDEVYSEHSLEHLAFYDAEDALKEWYRVLKIGGKMILKIPDLEICCANYVNVPAKYNEVRDKAKQWFRNCIYGIQRSLNGEPREAQIHKSGYSKDEIRKLVESVGFKVDKLFNYEEWDAPSIEVHAIK